MYRFTFIEEASNENEHKDLDLQENALEKLAETSKDRKNLIKKTAYFLHQYLDQPNCVRIFISKN